MREQHTIIQKGHRVLWVPLSFAVRFYELAKRGAPPARTWCRCCKTKGIRPSNDTDSDGITQAQKLIRLLDFKLDLVTVLGTPAVSVSKHVCMTTRPLSGKQMHPQVFSWTG